MEAIVLYLLMLQKISIQSKRFWNKKYRLCLGNISGDFGTNNMRKTGLNGCVYNFSVAYRAFDTSDIIDNHKYLMKKHDIEKCLC